MKRNNKILYEQIMKNVSKEIKRALNEIGENRGLYENNFKLFKQLEKLLNGNPYFQIDLPESRKYVAELYTDLKVLAYMTGHYIDKDENKLLVTSDLSVIYHYKNTWGENDIEIKELSSSTPKELVKKLNALYIDIQDKLSEEIDEDILDDTTPTERAVKLATNFCKRIKNIMDDINKLLPDPYNTILELYIETAVLSHSEDDLFGNDSISSNPNYDFNFDETCDYIAKLITIKEKYRSVDFHFDFNKNLEYLAEGEDYNIKNNCDNFIGEFIKYMESLDTDREIDDRSILFIFPSNELSTEEYLNDIIAISEEYRDFIAKNINMLK